jgi:RNA polymerase sigma factor (sigma-70 family)
MHTNVLADDATEERIPAPRRWVQPPPKLLSHLSDERLVARVRAGDDRAFEALYDRHHRPLLAFCRHLLGSADEAEDALQHTFIAAHRALRTDERPVMLRPWLFTIARNRCLSLLRSRRNVVALTEIEPTLPVTVGLAAQVEQRADLQALVHDLHALSDDQRAALVLSELGDLDHEQIANVLGVRRARVATLVFQARTSLMETRKARDTSCSDIQEQLATLRGGALRRTTLRRHVESCAACQAFRAEVRRQRAAMALILPVIPSLGLKRSVLHAISSGGGAAGAAAAAGGVSGSIAILGGSGAAGTGAVAGSAAVASSAAVVAAPAAATAVAATSVSAVTVAAGGAAVAAAGGAAVAAKALGVTVLVAAAVASGGPGLHVAAEKLGVAEKLKPTQVEATAPMPSVDMSAPAPAVAKGEGSKAAGTGHAGGSGSAPSGGSGSGSGTAAGAGTTTTDDADSSASETGSAAGAMPGEVVDDGMGSGTAAPADSTPPADTSSPAGTTPADPPPADTTTAADPPPATTTTTPAPAPAATTTTPAPAPATAPAEPPPAQTTTSEEPTPPADQGSGSGSGDDDDGPVATGASVDMSEPPAADPAPAEDPPAA